MAAASPKPDAVTGTPARRAPSRWDASPLGIGRRVALASVVISAALALTKVIVGVMARSTSVVADGLESAADAGASLLVLFGLTMAARPADENHPYGHGRFEILTGLLVGMILTAAGTGICFQSLQRAGEVHAPPAFFGIWPLLASILVKGILSGLKFHYGRKIRSSALVADASNDAVDILSGFTALTALGLTLYDPQRFLAADHYGGFAVGLIVIFTGLRVVKETTLHLMDTMPDEHLMSQIRRVAQSAPGVCAVEKCFARKTGLQYHVDIHIEVDPNLTVRQSHDIATDARIRIKEQLPWVADVLVHVEPALQLPSAGAFPGGQG